VLRPAGAGVERGEGGERVIPLDPLQMPAVVLGMAGAVFVVLAGLNAHGFLNRGEERSFSSASTSNSIEAIC